MWAALSNMGENKLLKIENKAKKVIREKMAKYYQAHPAKPKEVTPYPGYIPLADRARLKFAHYLNTNRGDAKELITYKDYEAIFKKKRYGVKTEAEVLAAAEQEAQAAASELGASYDPPFNSNRGLDQLHILRH